MPKRISNFLSWVYCGFNIVMFYWYLISIVDGDYIITLPIAIVLMISPIVVSLLVYVASMFMLTITEYSYIKTYIILDTIRKDLNRG